MQSLARRRKPAARMSRISSSSGHTARMPSTTCSKVFAANFFKPGNLEGGFAHYRAVHAGRIAMMKGDTSPLPRITTPTCVRWAEHDPLFPYAWTDRLGETFTDLDLALFPDVGHFPASRRPGPRRDRDRGIFRTRDVAVTRGAAPDLWEAAVRWRNALRLPYSLRPVGRNRLIAPLRAARQTGHHQPCLSP